MCILIMLFYKDDVYRNKQKRRMSAMIINSINWLKSKQKTICTEK